MNPEELQALAEECQLAMDLWLSEGKRLAAGDPSANYIQTRARMENAIERYHAKIRDSMFEAGQLVKP